MSGLLAEFRQYLESCGLAPSSCRNYVESVLSWRSSGLPVSDFLFRIDASSTFVTRRSGLKKFSAFLQEKHPEMPQLGAIQCEARKRTKANIPPYADILTVQAILGYMEKNARPVDFAVASAQYHAGLRIGECEALKLNNYHARLKSLRVPQCKTKARHVPIGNDLADVLSAYLSLVRPQHAPLDFEGLFVSPTGSPFKADRAYYRALKEAYRVNGVAMEDSMTAHWLRHMCGTHLLEAGAGLLDVRDILGHKSIATTEIYLHISPNRLRHVMDDLQKMKNQARSNYRREGLRVV